MFTLEELRKIDIEKIKKEIVDTEKTLYKARFEVKTSQSKDHHVISVNKRYIAKMKTVLTELQTRTCSSLQNEPSASEAKRQEPEPVTAPKKPKKTKTKAPKKA